MSTDDCAQPWSTGHCALGSNAGEAILNLDVVSKTPPSAQFTNPSTPGDRRLVNWQTLAFVGNYVIQGNLQWCPDLGHLEPAEADASVRTYVCPGSLRATSRSTGICCSVSAEATSGRIDCGLQVRDRHAWRRVGAAASASTTSPTSSILVADHRADSPWLAHQHVGDRPQGQRRTCTFYVSGSAWRPFLPTELEGCSRVQPDQDPNSAPLSGSRWSKYLWRTRSKRMSSAPPRIFNDLAPGRAACREHRRFARRGCSRRGGREERRT